MHLKYKCEYCNRTQYYDFNNESGIVIDESNWDGSDFFTITPLPKFIFVNKKVKDIIEKSKLKGIKLKPSTELRRTVYGADDYVSPY
jgi:hypothetical protein